MDHKNNTDKMLFDHHRGSFWAQGRVSGGWEDSEGSHLHEKFQICMY